MIKFLVQSGACIFATTFSDQETAAEKCEEDEENFDGCSQYLYGKTHGDHFSLCDQLNSIITRRARQVGHRQQWNGVCSLRLPGAQQRRAIVQGWRRPAGAAQGRRTREGLVVGTCRRPGRIHRLQSHWSRFPIGPNHPDLMF